MFTRTSGNYIPENRRKSILNYKGTQEAHVISTIKRFLNYTITLTPVCYQFLACYFATTFLKCIRITKTLNLEELLDWKRSKAELTCLRLSADGLLVRERFSNAIQNLIDLSYNYQFRTIVHQDVQSPYKSKSVFLLLETGYFYHNKIIQIHFLLFYLKYLSFFTYWYKIVVRKWTKTNWVFIG